MPDIALRFHKDMLVLSSPVRAALARQGVDVNRDLELITLIEPDSLTEAMRLEIMAGAQCIVANTAGLTPARMAQAGMEDRAGDVAAAALSVARKLVPQHILVEVGPCGLPLDKTSKASLNENRDQYARAARLFAGETFDAFFLNGFETTSDLLCALMGTRQASDAPVFASVDVLPDGTLASGRETLEDAVRVMQEYGASVVGFETGAPIEAACELASRAASVSDLPILVQLSVSKRDPKQGGPTDENPYYCPDAVVDAAVRLRARGVQFLRAVGDSTPAYTGALAATVAGLDVALSPREAALAAGTGAEDAGDAEVPAQPGEPADAGASAASEGAEVASAATDAQIGELAEALRSKVEAAFSDAGRA